MGKRNGLALGIGDVRTGIENRRKPMSEGIRLGQVPVHRQRFHLKHQFRISDLMIRAPRALKENFPP